MYLFTYVQSTAWATAVLIPISLGLFIIYSPMLVTGQNYLPNHIGFASGVTIGLAVTIGGVAAPILECRILTQITISCIGIGL